MRSITRLYNLGLVFASEDVIVNLRSCAPALDLVEASLASTHGASLMHPETIAQSLLQNFAGTALGQIRF